MDTHGFLTVEEGMRDTSHLSQHNACDRPRTAHLLQNTDVHADALLNDVVLAVWYQERPVRQMDDGRHDDDAGPEGTVVEQGRGELDQGGYVFGGCDAFRGVGFAGLGGEEELVGLDADVDVFDVAEAEVGARAVEHDCASGGVLI